jgi:asparagine synthase (glutamine-hydrolysing)
MCGITGWVDFSRSIAGQRAVAEAMTATMTCRGPDAGGVRGSEHALIGHRRLAVVDLPGGVQPMSEASTVLTFSGEIYNFRDLRRELEGYGHVFRTRSDTEVLLRAWLQWGADCLPRLNGMFAFAIWDGPARSCSWPGTGSGSSHCASHRPGVRGRGPGADARPARPARSTSV